MQLVEWNDSYSVGNALMDAHHRVFFDVVREFSALPDTDDGDAMMKRIVFLAEYAAMHLGAEEKLMRQAGYPDFDQHKAMHDAFTRQVEAAKESFFRDASSVTPEQILEMMQRWFVDHVLGEDKRYTPFLGKQG